MNNREKEFYTVRGYALRHQKDTPLTPSMEDYLEMIYRLVINKGHTRVGDLADALNVQPPSVTKMIQKLAEMGYLNYEKYGFIELTTQGKSIGAYLLKRHQTIEEFLRFIGVTENLLEETEKIEHNISESTLEKISSLMEFMKKNKSLMESFMAYLR